MRTTSIVARPIAAILLLAGAAALCELSFPAPGCGQSPPAQASPSLSDDALNELVSLVALYPDPLLAQILLASQYPSQITRAAQWLQQGNDSSQLDKQPWTPSVTALAHYPSVLNMMTSRIDWTTRLGRAFAGNQQAIVRAVQRMRRQARQHGNLQTNQEQKVVEENNVIQILPASQEVVYVPAYDPSVVYYSPPADSYSPLVTFGAGLALGGWIGSDVDWDQETVVYQGWNGGWGYYYGPEYAGHGWRTDTDWNVRTGTGPNGGPYAGYSKKTDWAGGAETGSYKAKAGLPGGAVVSDRGWGVEKDGNKAGAFSKTVTTQEGIYNVRGGGVETDSVSGGGVQVRGINQEGDYGSKTWTGSGGGVNQTFTNSGSIFEGRQTWNTANSFSSRGYQSRAESFQGGAARGMNAGGFRAGGFRGGGRR